MHAAPPYITVTHNAWRLRTRGSQLSRKIHGGKFPANGAAMHVHFAQQDNLMSAAKNARQYG